MNENHYNEHTGVGGTDKPFPYFLSTNHIVQ